MVIFIDPSIANPEPPEVIVSPDGILTATVHEAGGGVFLQADFTDWPTIPGRPLEVLRTNVARPIENPAQWGTGGGATNTLSTEWSAHGAHSIKVTPAGTITSAVYPYGLNVAMNGMSRGVTYTVSATVRLASPQTGDLHNGPRAILVANVNAGGEVDLGYAVSESAPNEAGEHRVSVTFTVPVDSTGVYFRLMNGSTSTPVWWDGLMIEEGDLGGSPEQVLRTNVIPNGGFTENVAGWSLYGAGVTAPVWQGGTLQFTGSNAYPRVWTPDLTTPWGAATGDTVYVRAKVRIVSGNGTPTGVIVQGRWSEGNVDANMSGWTTDVDGWRHIVTSMVAPAGVTEETMGRLLLGVTFAESSHETVVQVDDVYVSNVAGTFFDGDSATVGDHHYRWTGTPGASASEEYLPAAELPPYFDGDTTDPEDVGQPHHRWAWHGGSEEYLPAVKATLPPQWVRFERDGQPIFSGNPAAAPGGYGIAYDMFAPLGVPVTYRAVPILYDGTEGAPSEAVAVVLRAPAKWGNRRRVCWLKSARNPGLSMRVLAIGEPPTFDREGRVNLQSVPGTPLPAGSSDVQTAWSFSLEFLTEDKAEQARMEELLTSGTLLLQTPQSWQLRDMWVEPGTVGMTPHARMDTGAQKWTVALAEVAQPSTADTPLIIPGRSWQWATDTHTWNSLDATFDSWLAVVTPT